MSNCQDDREVEQVFFCFNVDGKLSRNIKTVPMITSDKRWPNNNYSRSRRVSATLFVVVIYLAAATAAEH